MDHLKRKLFEYENLDIGEELGSYEYVLSQEMLDRFRQSVGDPDAAFPTLAIKHDVTSFAMVYEEHTGSVNAGNEVDSSTHPYQVRKFESLAGLRTSIGGGTNPTWL